MVLGDVVGSHVWRSYSLFHQLAVQIANHTPEMLLSKMGAVTSEPGQKVISHGRDRELTVAEALPER